MSETKLPPGWVRLTAGDGAPLYLDAAQVRSVIAPDCYTHVDCGGTWQVTEQPAEVLARIAEAMRVRRRFEAGPIKVGE